MINESPQEVKNTAEAGQKVKDVYYMQLVYPP